MFHLWSGSCCVNTCKSRSWTGVPKNCNFSTVSKMLTENWWGGGWLHQVPVGEAQMHGAGGLKCFAFHVQNLLLNRKEAIMSSLSQLVLNPGLKHLLIGVKHVLMNLGESAEVEKVHTVCKRMSVLTLAAGSGKLWKCQSFTEGSWGYWEPVQLSWVQSQHPSQQNYPSPAKVIANCNTELRVCKELPWC